MSNIPDTLKYAKTHEWSRLEDDDIVRVGISDFAQEQLGDLVYVELPKVGEKVRAEQQCAVVESVKAASDLYSPVTGEIIAVNEAASDEPELVNDDAYNSWLFCIKTNDVSELEKLMSAEKYSQMIAE
jgi:glycine cleavage system H protein